jgi:hypothetical protein
MTDIALASRFANIADLEEMSYGALSWWGPLARAYIKGLKKGGGFIP